MPFKSWKATVVLLLLFLFSTSVRAQGTARSMDFDLSIASAGMGGASNGVFWGDIDYWGNPALLGYARGLRYLHTRSQLVPGLATDVFLNSDATQVGYGGLRFVSAGEPRGRGGGFLAYGAAPNTAPLWDPTRALHPFESGPSNGVGAGGLWRV